MPLDEPVEFFRSKDPEALKHVIAVLEQADIPHQVISEDAGFDFTTIGSDEDFEAFITMHSSDQDRARKTLEADSLNSDLPADHHLLHSSDDELIEIITHASEWSAFDVAHARRILSEHGVDSTKLEEDRAKRVSLLKKGSTAPQALILFGWIFSILGGLLGVAIAWFISQTKDKTPDGEFHRYDEASRKKGNLMFKVAIIVFFIGVFLRVFYFKS